MTTPYTARRAKGAAGHAAKPTKLDELHTVVLEIKGEEVVATLDEHTATGYILLGPPGRNPPRAITARESAQ